jgi:hypothetical protein
MFFRVVFLIVIVCLVLYALFIFLRYFDAKETQPVETPKTPTSNDDPEALLKKVELEIELMHTAIETCEERLKAGIEGEEKRLESLKNSLARIEELKQEYINKNK